MWGEVGWAAGSSSLYGGMVLQRSRIIRGPSVALEHVTASFSGFQLTHDLGGDVERYWEMRMHQGMAPGNAHC